MGLADFIKVYRFLRGIRYPATKQQLVDLARSNQADEEALSSLREMPEGEYGSPDEVSRVIAERLGRARARTIQVTIRPGRTMWSPA